MNTFGRIFAIMTVSLVLAGALAALPALTLPTEPPVLLRMEVPSVSFLEQWAALDVPAHALLTNSQGRMVLLAILSPEQQRLAQATGMPMTILDADARDAVYYLVEGDASYLKTRSVLPWELLYADGRQAVIRLRSNSALADLEALGVRTSRLGPEPIALNFPTTGAIPTTVPYDPLVADLIAQITATTLLSEVGGLSGEWDVLVGGAPYRLLTRYTYSGMPVAKATQYVYERLQALGYNVTYHPYTLNGYSLRNVIAEKPGRVAPERIVLLTAHLDSRAATSPHNPAPGADDNASGCAALLQTAELLADTDFAFTIRFVFFTGEEQGMRGSSYYAAAVAAAQENIIGVLNLDMIAWDAVEGPDIDLHTHLLAVEDDSDRLAALFASVIQTYSLELTPQIVEEGTRFSDHSPFWDLGYAALLAIEDYVNSFENHASPIDWNPYYHTVNDRLSTLNGDYFCEFARASMATLMHLAEPMRTLSGTVTADDTGLPLTATVTVSGSWGTFAGETTAGVYALSLPGGVFTVTAEASGYFSQTIAAFNVLTGTHARLDFALMPLPNLPAYSFVLQGAGTALGDPGDLVTHTVTIANTGALSDTYALGLGASVFTSTLPITLTGWLSPGHTLTAPVWVQLPVSSGLAFTSTLRHDIVTLTVSSVMSPVHTATLPLRTAFIAGRVYLPVVLRVAEASESR
ncbi:MAG: M20/M25/M40 family metallo-hydrolase [Anaerolineae bacterium]|nr:M20/M25/M40 family metallo-hydrolase [Anaerolineae bacterium]